MPCKRTGIPLRSIPAGDGRVKRPNVEPIGKDFKGGVMRSIFVLTAILLAAIATHADESAEERIVQAVAALPEALRDGATVLSFDENGDSSVLRQGTNYMICWADEPTERFIVSCFPKSKEKFEVRKRELRAGGAEDWRDVLNREIRSGKLPLPDGAITYTLLGSRFALALPNAVIHVPYATPESTGLSTQPDGFRPWLMRPGQPRAHIMLPGK